MSRGVILTTDGFDAVQFEYVRHRLREDGMLVDVVSPHGGPLEGTRNLRVADSVAVEEAVEADRYDLVVVPGGERLAGIADDAAVRTWLRAHVERRTVVGAIAEGIDVLDRSGLHVGRHAAGSRTAERESSEAVEWRDELVTVDGNLVTARDPDALPYFVAAALDNVVLRQRADDDLVERPAWE